MMNLKNFILEIGVEELPASLLKPISNHIKEEIKKVLDEQELKFGEFEIEYTPRRMFFEIKELESQTEAKTIELRGPPLKAAKDENGNFTQAALGFAKKNKASEKDLTEKDGYIYAKLNVPGVSTKELLENKLSEIISNVPGERFMRWAYSEVKFSRPILWIAALLFDDKENEVIKFKVEDIESSNKSYGHRFLAPDQFEIKNTNQYLEQLKKQGVYLKTEERKEIIINKSKELAHSIGGDVLIKEELLEEVVGLIENPTPILCNFNKEFLELPNPVTVTVMSIHQRYFPVLKKGSEELLPNFITVSNNPLKEAEKNIKEGNEKVIVPRLKDGEFFFQEDNKIKLRDRLEKLEKVNFQSGNMLQKSQRVEEIAKYLSYELSTTYEHNPEKLDDEKLDKETRDLIAEAALLAKTDLSTQMVFEFTELQGEIGGIYALKQGEDEVIAKAIEDHYKPRFAGDLYPKTIGGKIISIADRVDNIVLLFALGKIPKGSADPFALRRQANGLLEIVLHCHLITNLDKLVDFAIETGKSQLGNGKKISKSKGKGENKKTIEIDELDWEKARDAVKEFLRQRMEFVFEIYHNNSKANKAVLSAGNPLEDPNRKHMMIHFVYGLEEEKNFDAFREAANRLMKIGDKEMGDIVDPKKFVDDSEKALYETLKKLGEIKHKQIINDVPAKTDDLFTLVKPINNFFDSVLVNDENKEIKENRHKLVNYGSSILEEFADFTLL